jgi:hypothetical protein
MARSSRSSRLRTNREKKRIALYGPKNDEALTRLNAKLNEIKAQSPPPPPVNKPAQGAQPETKSDLDAMITDELGL